MTMRAKVIGLLLICTLVLAGAAVLAACGTEGGTGGNKCYYTISENLPQYVERVSVYTDMLSSDEKGDYIIKGKNIDIIVTMENEFYDASGIKAVVNDTAYDLSPYANNGSNCDYYVNIKAESDMTISATGTATETVQDFTIDCPTDAELSEYCGERLLPLTAEQQNAVLITFSNFDQLAEHNPEQFGTDKFFGKESYTYTEFKTLFAAGSVTIQAGRVNGVQIKISYAENTVNDPYESFIATESFEFIQEDFIFNMHAQPVNVCVTDGAANGADSIEYYYYLFGNNERNEINDLLYKDCNYFSPYIYVDKIYSPSLYGVLSDVYFDYDDSTKTIAIADEYASLFQDVYEQTTIKINGTVLGKFDAEHSSYTLDKRPFEYIADWNGKIIPYSAFLYYNVEADFAEQAYKAGKCITEADFVSNFTSVVEGTSGELPFAVKFKTDGDESAIKATALFGYPYSAFIDDKDVTFYIRYNTYDLSFTFPQPTSFNEGSTVKLTFDGTTYTYKYEFVFDGSSGSYDWVSQDTANPDLTFMFDGSGTLFEIHGIFVQDIPSAIEIYIAPQSTD